jgi:hypothetical protein
MSELRIEDYWAYRETRAIHLEKKKKSADIDRAHITLTIFPPHT